MRGSNEVLCSLLLGVGQMAMMTGYLGSSNVLESVLRTVSARDPTRIDAHAGYYGQSMIYGTYTVANLFTPTLVGVLGSKRMLVLGSSLFTLYLLSFLYLYSVSFYACAGLMGVGYAIFYSGHGAYLAEHSSRRTVERNSALVLAAACWSLIVGGTVLLISSIVSDVETPDAPITSKVYRDFSTNEIVIMQVLSLFACFSAISIGSNILFAFLPSKIGSGSLVYTSSKPRLPFLESISMMLSTLIHPRMLLLSFYFLTLGLFNGFVLGIYPTCFAFTKSLSAYRFLPAAAMVSVGAGDVIMGLLLSFLSRRVRNFGLVYSLIIGVALLSVCYSLIFFSIPEWSFVHPTEEPSRAIEPSVLLCLSISFIFGLADACVMTARTVICAVAMPERRDQVFAVSKLYQSLSSAIMFFTTPAMSVTNFIALLGGSTAIGCAAYFTVVATSDFAKVETSKESDEDSAGRDI